MKPVWFSVLGNAPRRCGGAGIAAVLQAVVADSARDDQMRRVPDARWRTLPRAATFGGLQLVTLVLAFAAIVGAAVLAVLPALFLVAGWLGLAVGVYLSARLAIAAHFRRSSDSRIPIPSRVLAAVVGQLGGVAPNIVSSCSHVSVSTSLVLHVGCPD